MKFIIERNSLNDIYSEFDIITINNKDYTLYLSEQKYLFLYISNIKNKKYEKILLKDLLYCYYNNIKCINRLNKIIHVNNNLFDFSKSNLKIINKFIDINNNSYKNMFMNTNIDKIQFCKENSIITLFDRKFKVYKNNESKLGVFIPFRVENETKYTFLYIKNIVYFYFNKIISIPDDYKVIYKNGNINDNSIKNLILVKYKIYQHEFEDFNFRFNNVRYTDYYNIKENDIIPFCNNYYKVTNIKNDLYIKIRIIKDKKYLIKEIPIKKIIFEFFNNKRILNNPLIDLSIELLSLMNYDINNIKEFSVEDMNSTNSYQGFEEYTEFK